jgi:hypothetical protein
MVIATSGTKSLSVLALIVSAFYILSLENSSFLLFAKIILVATNVAQNSKPEFKTFKLFDPQNGCSSRRTVVSRKSVWNALDSEQSNSSELQVHRLQFASAG